MTSVEDRLRQALAEGTEHIQWSGTRTVPARRRRVLPSLLAPIAVAAAVAIILVLGFSVVQSRTHGPSSATRSGVPRYLVAALMNDDGALSVIDTSNGKVTAHVPSPLGLQEMSGVSPTTDRHTFYVFATIGSPPPSKPPTPGGGGHPAASTPIGTPELFRLRIDSAGKHPQLTPVMRIPEGAQIDRSVISPDGTRLAVANESGPDGSLRIDVTTLATGHRQIFTTSGNQPGGDIQWLADGRRLAFSLGSVAPASTGNNGLWMLNTDSTDGDLLRSSRRVVRRPGSQCWITSTQPMYDQLSGDGSKVYVASRHGSSRQITECDMTTGGPPRVLFRQVAGTAWGVTVDATAGGRLMVVNGNRAYLIDTGTGRTATVSFTHPPFDVAW